MNVQRIVELAKVLQEAWNDLQAELTSDFELKSVPRVAPVGSHKRRKSNAVSKEKLLSFFKKHEDRGFTVSDLATRLKTENAILRGQLKYLQAAGVVERMGNTYRATGAVKRKPRKIVLDGAKRKPGRPPKSKRTIGIKGRTLPASVVAKMTAARRQRAEHEAVRRKARLMDFFKQNRTAEGHNIREVSRGAAASEACIKRELPLFEKEGLIIRTIGNRGKPLWSYAGGKAKARAMNGHSNGVSAHA